MRQEYIDLINRQREEINDFPIYYAFDEKQLEEALKKLGATKGECVTIFGDGDIVKKEDAPKFIEMLKRHTMDNHEYAINYSGDDDVLGCFGLEMDDLEDMGLDMVLRLARKKHFDYMRECGAI